LAGVGFHDNLAAADAILTTSVAEGFGMAFLESWTAQRMLVGRDLPEITADFTDAGVVLDTLYASLRVPLTWVGQTALRDSMRGFYDRVLTDFGLPLPTEQVFDRELQYLVQDGAVDFACLETALQQRVVQRVWRDHSARDLLLQRNPMLQAGLDAIDGDSGDRIASNDQVVRERFSLRSSGQRLRQLYAQVAASPRTDQLDPLASGRGILDAFLSLARLQPLRVEL
jgi:hypothetical protein